MIAFIDKLFRDQLRMRVSYMKLSIWYSALLHSQPPLLPPRTAPLHTSIFNALLTTIQVVKRPYPMLHVGVCQHIPAFTLPSLVDTFILLVIRILVRSIKLER